MIEIDSRLSGKGDVIVCLSVKEITSQIGVFVG